MGSNILDVNVKRSLEASYRFIVERIFVDCRQSGYQGMAGKKYLAAPALMQNVFVPVNPPCFPLP